jgi:hypothetical protein
VVAAEYQQHFGEHAYDAEGNYIGQPIAEGEVTAAEQAWAEYYAEYGDGTTARAAEAGAGSGVADVPEGGAAPDAESAALDEATDPEAPPAG